MRRFVLTALVVPVLALAACGGDDSSGSSSGGGGGGGGGDIVIGASVPMTGPLGVIGPQVRGGYEEAVKEVNDAGGIQVGDAKRKVKLVILDNKSDPNVATQQARTLVNKNGAVALLGACTPPLNVPLSATAETLRIPIISTCTPVRAFLAGSKSGWHYAWDLFFDEEEATKLSFKTADLTKTNKKVALFTDNEADGVVMGGLWEKNAPAMGYQIVEHAKFPVGTTTYSSFINKAKSAGAEIVIAQMVPPDGIALWKQMKSLGYSPKLAFCEKCAASSGWVKGLGKLAEGTGVFLSFTPDSPEGKTTVDALKQSFPATADLSIAVNGSTAAQVLFDAISAAGGTDADKVNEAIGKTDKTYASGPVKFTDNAAALTTNMLQWQGTDTKQVYPPVEGQELQAPIEGLK
jgi:branched-chain amino acid transport system substrate-binding protein